MSQHQPATRARGGRLPGSCFSSVPAEAATPAFLWGSPGTVLSQSEAKLNSILADGEKKRGLSDRSACEAS